jgi:hypothetical protein
MCDLAKTRRNEIVSDFREHPLVAAGRDAGGTEAPLG